MARSRIADASQPGCIRWMDTPNISKRMGASGREANIALHCGLPPRNIPDIPLALGEATHICGTSGRRRDGSRMHKGDKGWRPEITKAEREHTPIELAHWLYELACRCKFAN